MADYRPEDVSSKYLSSIEDVPVEMVGVGLLGLVLFLVMGHFLTKSLKSWSFQRRQAKRRKANAPPPGPGGKGRSRRTR